MSPRRTSTHSPAELMAFLLAPAAGALSSPAQTGRLAGELGAWLADVPRFRAFADANRDKIRRKLRQAGDADAAEDLRAELNVAHRLLGDRAIELAYEPGGTRTGGPDFAVTYRAGRPFNLEVTRPRWTGSRSDPARTLLAKLRQLPTGVVNVLLLAVPGDPAAADVGASVRNLRARADAKDEAWFATRGFSSTRDFYDRFLRLSAVITWSETGGALSWTNASARIPIPDRALRACLNGLTA